jgi:hypothetical protein
VGAMDPNIPSNVYVYSQELLLVAGTRMAKVEGGTEDSRRENRQ